jgi:hypothetical protein
MRSVRDISIEEGATNSSLRSLFQIIGDRSNSLRQAVALHDVKKRYLGIGGYGSIFGMPVTPDYTAIQKAQIQRNGNGGYVSNFRSGNINVSDVTTGQTESDGTWNAQVFLVGLECQIRQESEDEVYGSVGSVVTSTHASRTTPFPIQKMGPDNERIVKMDLLVYERPIANLALLCYLIEHDSGDEETVKQAVEQKIQQAAAAIGSAFGVPSEALASDSNIWLLDIALDPIMDKIGAGDDAYNPQTLQIPAEDIKAVRDGKFVRKTLTRNDDPQVVTYTHSQVLSGRDDGGDTGVYCFYFDIKTGWIIPDPYHS